MQQGAGLQRFFASSAARQSGVLIGLQGLSMILSFALTILLARGLDVAAYGTFRYAMIFLALGMTLLQFGAPYSAARLLALEADRAVQREIVGACVILVGVNTMIGVVITGIAVLGSEALGQGLPRLLIWVAPALYVTLGQAMISSTCQGMGRIYVLSLQQVLPYVILIPATALQLLVWSEYTVLAAIVTYVAAFTVVIMFGFRQLEYEFGHWRTSVRRIVAENRKTGFPIYVGGVLGVASAQIIAIWVAEFASGPQYGQYALALAVSTPLGVLVSSVGTVVFRSGAQSRALSKPLLAGSFGFAALLGVVFFAAVECLLVWAFGVDYGPSVRMAQVLGASSLMTGCGDIFQRFLGAHGLGKRLGLAAAGAGLVGVAGAAMFLEGFAVYGAIIASVMAGAAYLFAMVALYVHYTSREAGLLPAAR